MATMSEPQSQSPAFKDVAGIVVRRLWFFFVSIFLAVTMFAIVAPLFQYIILTFFASGHGGGDCMVTPKSDACRLGAGDMTTYNSIVGAITSTVACFSAVTLGSLSDSIGRRRIFIVKGVLSVAMLYALALYELAGFTLWIFLAVKPLSSMWDLNGVSLALMADVIPERHMRSAAMSITIAGCSSIVLVCLALAALLPVEISFFVALIAGTLQLLFYLAYFPETKAEAPSHNAELRQSPAGAFIAASRIFGRNTFISRMACIAAISGMATRGSAIIVQPYLTAYIGMQRQQLVAMMVATIVSVLFTLGVLAKPMTTCLGDVKTYQVCLLGVALKPGLLCLCSEPWHVMVAVPPLMGFTFLQVPIISAVKSNLVSNSEQGLMQGALASLVNMASAVAAPIFGWLYNSCTDGGADHSRSSAFPSFLAAAALGVAAFLVSLSLPSKVPEPEPAVSGLAHPSSVDVVGEIVSSFASMSLPLKGSEPEPALSGSDQHSSEDVEVQAMPVVSDN